MDREMVHAAESGGLLENNGEGHEGQDEDLCFRDRQQQDVSVFEHLHDRAEARLDTKESDTPEGADNSILAKWGANGNIDRQCELLADAIIRAVGWRENGAKLRAERKGRAMAKRQWLKILHAPADGKDHGLDGFLESGGFRRIQSDDGKSSVEDFQA